MDKKVEKDVAQDIEKDVKKEEDAIIEKKIEKQPEKQIARNNEIEPAPKIKERKQPIQRPERVIEPKREKIQKIEKPKQEITKKETPKITEPKTEPKKDIAKLEKDVRSELQNQIYTIQVYSSPSLEDAQDWVKKLKSYNIDAYISEQMIRDVKWYRVRFGYFSTREEARSVALRYGFSQSWIDRIK